MLKKIVIGVVFLLAFAFAAGRPIYTTFFKNPPEEEESTKTISEMTFEEQDQVRAILKAEFKNYDVLEEEDMITLVLDHEYLAGGLRCYPSGPDIDRIPLTPGFCNVTSSSGSKTSFTVDNIDQYFILEVDYAAGTMAVRTATREEIYEESLSQEQITREG